MFYQSDNSLDGELLKIEFGSDFSFPPHLHNSFELITVTEGEMTVTLDEREYVLQAGEAVLVFPNQIHALSTERTSRHILCIFSPQLVRAYSGVFGSRLPTDSRFVLDRFYVGQLSTLEASQSTLEIKGFLYSVCAAFDRGRVYEDKANKKKDLLHTVFHFVEENYRGDCSLEALSARLSYHGVYLSRYFKQRTGLAFSAYVNRYRVNEASYVLRNSQKKILDVAYECGFDSLRSFNRNFKAVMGVTPNEYRGCAGGGNAELREISSENMNKM